MKKILFAATAIVACTFVSCKDDKTAEKSDPNAKYKDMNAKIYHTIESGDTTGLRDWIASDAVDHGGGANGADVKGADNIISMLGSIHNSFQPGMKSTIINTSTDGDYLYTLSSMSGTTTAAPGMGMPPNQKMDMMQVDVVRIKDGKASEHWNYVSAADMMKMMGGGKEGMMPPPPMGPDDRMPADKMKADSAKKM